jgi:hypothetical protein
MALGRKEEARHLVILSHARLAPALIGAMNTDRGRVLNTLGAGLARESRARLSDREDCGVRQNAIVDSSCSFAVRRAE